MVGRFALGLILLCMPVTGFAEELDKSGAVDDIKSLLLGNSIMHPTFGCSFYETGDRAVQHKRNGDYDLFKWWVGEGVYFSTGACGAGGCRVYNNRGVLDFHRIDGQYQQKALLLKGNQCESNRKVS